MTQPATPGAPVPPQPAKAPDTAAEERQLAAGIAALEAQRTLLGDAVVDASLTGLRTRLAALQATADTAESTAAAQALRQVSILFLDIVGSTSLSQQLDPEAVHAVMDGALARCTHVVQAHRGRVLQYAGDNLLAAFGAGEVHEDDAESAVRCGLALLAEGRQLGREVQQAHAYSGFDVRVGVHTGPVLLGGGVDGDGTIRGIAVNIAARMEQTAPAGSLRISQATESFVQGLFEVEAQVPALVKGVQDPMASFLVLRALPRSFHTVTRGIAGLATSMLGRDAELSALQAALWRVAATRRLHALAVVGEAGLGKSRLLREFEAGQHLQATTGVVLRGRAHPHTREQTFGLLRDVLARWLDIADDTPLPVAQARFEAGVVALLAPVSGAQEALAQAHRLGYVVGLGFADSPWLRGLRDDPRQLRERAFEAAAMLLSRLQAGASAPALLLLEDLHWADDATLDFLAWLAAQHGDLVLLLLALTRPALFERRPDALAEAQRLELSPLGSGESERLAAALWQPPGQSPQALRELLIGRAAGNPFFMEELVKMLIDQRVVETAAGQWSLHAERLRPDAVPLTLTGVLQARLDGLPAAERRALQEASVIGAVFWEQALREVAGPAALQLPALVRRALALPRPDSAGPGWPEYAFSHHLLHQVTYDTVLQSQRRVLHARIADWLSGLGEALAREHLADIAEHHERAGDAANAAAFWAQAARNAYGRMAPATALAQVQRALDLLDKGSVPDEQQAPLRWRLLAQRWSALDLLGRRSELLACGEVMEGLAQRMAALPGSDARLAQAAFQRSIACGQSGDWPRSEGAAREALALATRADDTVLRLRAQHRVSVALRHLGRYEQAQALGNAGLEEARALALPDVERQFLSALANIAEERGDLWHSQRLHTHTLDLVRALGLRRSEAIALGNLGNVHEQLGDLTLARRYLEGAIGLMRGFGDRFMLCAPLCCLAVVAARQGWGEEALVLAQEAEALAADLGAHQRLRLAWLSKGHALRASGRRAEAAQAYQTCHREGLAADDTVWLDAAAALIELALDEDDTIGALAWAEPALVWLDGEGSGDGGEALVIDPAAWAALHRAGDARAPARLQRAHQELQAQAARIDDAATRQRFLDSRPAYRQVSAAWQAVQAHQAGGP